MKQPNKLTLIPFFFIFYFLYFISPASAQTQNDWYMAGANPQRTSWVASTQNNQTEIKGTMKVLWYKPIESYILPRTQIIAANGLLYVSTANGLYAFDAQTGEQVWVYPTGMPLGHSPTVVDGIAYVGGYDHKLHAVDALTGQGKWTFEAEQGFATNPLFVNGKIFAGNRDGWFYALNAATGTLVWKYQTAGPVLFSAAEKDGLVYFASNDSHAYALDAENGDLVWKSQKLPGQGFHSWWPVVYKDWVIFAGSQNYRTDASLKPLGSNLHGLERYDVYPNYATATAGTLVGPIGQAAGSWVTDTPTIDISQPNTTTGTNPISEYFETPILQELTNDTDGRLRRVHKPWRRTVFVLNRETGEEYQSDLDADGKFEYAPFLYYGSDSGNRYPALVGSDQVLYMTNNYHSNPWICTGQISGWEPFSKYISIISGPQAIDEPLAYASGGNVIYWNKCCDRSSGAIDISLPNLKFYNNYLLNPGNISPGDPNREWSYYGYNLRTLIPGYDYLTYFPQEDRGDEFTVFGNINGIYGYHGDQNPPVPYKGSLYSHRSNVIMAFSSDGTNGEVGLPIAKKQSVAATVTVPTKESLRQKLADQVAKIITAGHLRPGWHSTGLTDHGIQVCGSDDPQDYFHNTGETLVILLKTLPYLSANLQDQLDQYLQKELTDYPPYKYIHNGWLGASREIFDIPPEQAKDLVNESKYARANQTYDNYSLGIYTADPAAFYALWKYAAQYGNAKVLFESAKNTSYFMNYGFNFIPTDEILLARPHVLNNYIVGYQGFLELEKMAGYPETASVKNQYERLLALRLTNFSKDVDPVFRTRSACNTINIARNFMLMTPELASLFRQNLLAPVAAAITEYETLAPYWFVTKSETQLGEGILEMPYNHHALFQAKAKILNTPYEGLVKYLDVPTFETGDLYFIDNLVTALEAPVSGDTAPTCTGDLNSDSIVSLADLAIVLTAWGHTSDLGDTNTDGVVNLADIAYILSKWGSCQ